MTFRYCHHSHFYYCHCHYLGADHAQLLVGGVHLAPHGVTQPPHLDHVILTLTQRGKTLYYIHSYESE